MVTVGEQQIDWSLVGSAAFWFVRKGYEGVLLQAEDSTTMVKVGKALSSAVIWCQRRYKRTLGELLRVTRFFRSSDPRDRSRKSRTKRLFRTKKKNNETSRCDNKIVRLESNEHNSFHEMFEYSKKKNGRNCSSD